MCVTNQYIEFVDTLSRRVKMKQYSLVNTSLLLCVYSLHTSKYRKHEIFYRDGTYECIKYV